MPELLTLAPESVVDPRILIIDDSSDDRVLIRRHLERELPHAEIVEAHSLDRFSDVLEREPFDVVITDYHLGWADGLELFERVRAEWPGTAVVVCTGTGTEEVAVEALKGGVDDYVVKSRGGFQRLPLAVVRAIERHRQRGALTSAEAEVRELLERLPAGIYRSALSGALLYGNPAFLELFGVSDPSELLGSDLNDVYVEQDARTRWIKLLEREGVAVVEFETHRPDEGTRWIRNHGRLVRSSRGEPLFIEGVIHDITARKRAEAETERRGRYLSLLQSVTAVANELEDFEDAIERAMGTICDQVGWPVAHVYAVSEDEDVLEPRPIWVHHNQNGSAARTTFERVTAEASFRSGEGLIGRVHRSGRPEWIEDVREDDRFLRADAAVESGLLSVVAVPVLAGTRTHAVIEILHSQPQPRDAGLLEALYQAGIQLGRVVERQASAEEHARIEAKAGRAQKMEAVGRLAGGIAHDFNNLITVLLMESKGALGLEDVPEEARAALRSIFETAERAALLTRQLLSFSKGRPGKVTTVDVGDVLKDLQPMLQRIIGEQHTLDLRVGEESTLVRIDRVELDQVLLNLIVNARDAMPEGGPITLAAMRRRLPRGPVVGTDSECVVINVSDRGHGIPEKLREAIFEPFFSTKAEHGTGLGLSICYGIVTTAGGDLRVYSEEGVGTTFSIVLPAVDAGGREEPTPEQGPSLVPTGSETILVVEDEVSVRRVTARALEAQGYTALEVGSAEEALAVLAEGDGEAPVGLLLSDVVLPGMGGLELYAEVRDRYPTLPVLLTSGYGEEMVRSQLDGEGPAVVIQKPFSVAELARKVRRLLDERRPEGDGEA